MTWGGKLFVSQSATLLSGSDTPPDVSPLSSFKNPAFERRPLSFLRSHLLLCSLKSFLIPPPLVPASGQEGALTHTSDNSDDKPKRHSSFNDK